MIHVPCLFQIKVIAPDDFWCSLFFFLGWVILQFLFALQLVGWPPSSANVIDGVGPQEKQNGRIVLLVGWLPSLTQYSSIRLSRLRLT